VARLIVWTSPREPSSVSPALTAIGLDGYRLRSTSFRPQGLPMHGSMIEVEAVTKRFGSTVAAVRASLEAGPAARYAWQSLAWSAAIFIVFFAIALHLYRTSTA
jgi:hypothetical protein